MYHDVPSTWFTWRGWSALYVWLSGPNGFDSAPMSGLLKKPSGPNEMNDHWKPVCTLVFMFWLMNQSHDRMANVPPCFW